MLKGNIRSSRDRGNIAPPAPSPALAAALAPLRAYRAAHPFPSRTTLPTITPEQFAGRAQTWATYRDSYLEQQADERRAEVIADLDADWTALFAQEAAQ